MSVTLSNKASVEAGASQAPWRGNSVAGKVVCLINPPSPFLLDERVFPSLGMLKVASALEAGGAKVHVLDLSGIDNTLELLRDFLVGREFDAVGITATTPQLPAVMDILAVVRQVRPGLKVILGGPHVTLIYSALKMELKRGFVGRARGAAEKLEAHFDVLCSGDGEIAIFQALKDDAPKVIDGDDHTGPLFLSNELYEDSPRPARHLIDLKSYKYGIEGFPATSLIAQLGCPFGCGFCGGRNSKSLRLIRNRSVESIIQEIEFLHKEYGFTGFMFYDDELNVSKTMVQLMDAISDYQDRNAVEFRLRGFVKSELFTEAQAQSMYRAGFRWLLCGFEAADERILINIEKRAGKDDNTRAVEIAKRHGLKVKALMSCGHPGESEASIQAIHDWLIENRVDDFDCTIITPYPGTSYHDLAVPHESLKDVWTYTQPKTGDRLHAHAIDYLVTANYYKGVPGSGYKSFVFTDHLDAEKLVAMRDWLEEDVRAKLNIPFNPGRAALRYEHSMGQGLPEFIYKVSDGKPVA